MAGTEQDPKSRPEVAAAVVDAAEGAAALEEATATALVAAGAGQSEMLVVTGATDAVTLDAATGAATAPLEAEFFFLSN